MKNLLIILAITTFFSCNKSDDSEIPYGTNLDRGIQFSVFNSENEDLLNPDSPNHLDVSKIKLFYVVNGEEIEVYNPNLDHPRNINIFEYENVYRIGISLNDTETSDRPITYLRWNDQDFDTIEVTYERSPGAVLKNRVWLNGEEVWERGDNTIDAYFTLIK